MLLDLQRILLGGTRLIGVIRDYTDPTTITTWKSKRTFSRGGLIGFGMASNFQPRVSLTRFTQVSVSRAGNMAPPKGGVMAPFQSA